MYDYIKMWIYDARSIDAVLQNPGTKKDYVINEDGTRIGITGSCGCWRIKTISENCLEVAGSIHKYWNNGTNENNFTLPDARSAIKRFCTHFDINPSDLFIKNLEFGVNLQIPIDASELMQQVICFNNLQPIRPYQSRPDCFFLEFEQFDYFLKIYDKGKQYKKQLPGTPNTLRVEIKGRNSRFFAQANIRVLEDLLNPDNFQVLGMKFAKLINGIVFDDDTICVKELRLNDKKLYRELCNPRKWKQYRGNASSTFRYRLKRFKEIVEHYGKRKIYTTLKTAVKEKIQLLSTATDSRYFQPNTYTSKSNKTRVCLSCGRDISSQHVKSRFCSAKYVGERAAKRCRNGDSNPRNNMSRKIKKIEGKGVLFPIRPYVIKQTKTAYPERCTESH